MKTEMILLGVTYLSGIMLPGPSMYILLRIALIYSRREALKSVLGIISAIMLQSLAIILAISLLSDKVMLYLNLLSALFLLYLGIKILIYRNDNVKINQTKYHKSFINSFFVEALNPLAFSFLIAILSTSISSDYPIIFKFIILLEITIIGFLWFGLIAVIASYNKISCYIRSYSSYVEFFSGSVFISYGIIYSLLIINKLI